MTEPDDEFDDFLARRKPVFRRSTEDPFEPPEELDRIVLRQAREAIERERPDRVFHGPRWGMPVALAASLLVVFAIVLHLGVQNNKAPQPEVTVQSISQQIEYPMAASQPAPAAPAAMPAEPPADDVGGAPMADLHMNARARAPDSLLPDDGFAASSEGSRYAAPPPPPPVASNGTRAEQPATAGAASDARRSGTVVMSAPPPSEAERAVASASSTPVYRRDAATWQAEINRLRAEGKTAEADAEQAEFKRQHRAYAGSPDR